MLNLINAWQSEGSFFNAFPAATLWITCLVVVAAAVYSYYTVKYRYWKVRNIPGPPPTLPLGNAMAALRGAWQEEDMRRVAKYGKVYGIYNATSPVLTVLEPEILKDILIRDFHAFADRQAPFHKIQKQSLIAANGKRWKDQRTILSPTFTSGKMKAMHPLIKHCISNLIKHIDSQLDSGVTVFNSKVLFGDLTLDVIASCAFATDTNAHQERGNNIFVKNAKSFFNLSRFKLMLMALLPEAVKAWLQFTPTPRDSLDFMINTAQQILNQRKNLVGSSKFVDMLQLMMDAERVAEDGTKDKLTDEEIISNIILILIAGYETTSSLLTYATYSLAMNPEVQSRLREEIETAVEADGGRITYDTIMSLKYLDAVVNETLRLYAAVVRTERVTTMDYEIKSLGLKLSKGTKVQVPIFAIHHQEDFYPDPYKFDPERFMPENKDRLVPYTFLPFITGPRNCIGARFALLEAKTALATVLMKYNLNRCSQTAEHLDFSESTIILQAKEVMIGFTART